MFTAHTLNIRRKFEARNNKSPFDKGGFRGNVDTDSRKKESFCSPLFP